MYACIERSPAAVRVVGVLGNIVDVGILSLACRDGVYARQFVDFRHAMCFQQLEWNIACCNRVQPAIVLVYLKQNGEAVGQELFQMNTELLQYRSEEHTSELQSRENLVCRLLL